MSESVAILTDNNGWVRGRAEIDDSVNDGDVITIGSETFFVNRSTTVRALSNGITGQPCGELGNAVATAPA